MKKEIVLIVGIFILALLAAGVFGYFYLKNAASPDNLGNTDSNGAPSGEEPSGNSESSSGNMGYRSRDQLPPFPPNWDKINYGADVLSEISAEAKKRQDDQFKIIIEGINKNPDTLDFWIDLGLIKKIFEDYAGARDAWEYASLIRPKNSVSFSNLGDLYWHFLKDYPKAELNFKTALFNMPENLAIYKELSDLYRFSYTAKVNLADDILLDGLAKNPKSVELLVWLGGYYRDTGDKTNAKLYFEKALALEPTNDSIKRELESL